jgi:hypothetical protein
VAVEITLQAQIQSLRTAVEGRLSAEEPALRVELPWQPGERVTATVEALRQGERALLRIGAFVFDARLPAGAEVGQRLNLTFVSSSPRITFALPEEAPGAPPPAAARLGVEISPAARNLNALIQAIAPQRQAEPTAIRDPVPLLSAPVRDAAPLAAALQRSVSASGLFYESHLAQWAAGERPLALLQDEPQGRIAARPAAPLTPPASHAGVAPDAIADDQPPQAPAAARASAAEPSRLLEPVDPRSIAQVRAQIESLDARQIVWQGQPWPGLPMEWRVDEPTEENRSPDEPTPWSSRLKLTFPVLGEVVADLVLTGDALRVRLHAPHIDTRIALGEAQELLRDGLERASIRLAHFAVDE